MILLRGQEASVIISILHIRKLGITEREFWPKTIPASCLYDSHSALDLPFFVFWPQLPTRTTYGVSFPDFGSLGWREPLAELPSHPEFYGRHSSVGVRADAHLGALPSETAWRDLAAVGSDCLKQINTVCLPQQTSWRVMSVVPTRPGILNVKRMQQTCPLGWAMC